MEENNIITQYFTKGKDGPTVYPITHESAVITENGKTLKENFQDLTTTVTEQSASATQAAQEALSTIERSEQLVQDIKDHLDEMESSEGTSVNDLVAATTIATDVAEIKSKNSEQDEKLDSLALKTEEKFSELEEKIGEYNIAPLPLSPGYVIYSTGEIKSTSSISFSHTDRIEVSNIESVRFEGFIRASSSTTSFGCAFYDADDVYISGVRYTPNTSDEWVRKEYNVVIPDGAIYMRISVRNELADTFYCYLLSKESHEVRKADKSEVENVSERVEELALQTNEIDEVTAHALNDLNDRVTGLEESPVTEEGINEIDEVTAHALNDLNDRVEKIEEGEGVVGKETRLPRLDVVSKLLFVNGNDISGLNTSKNEVACEFQYSGHGHSFKDSGTIAYQGNTSIQAPKKGFSISFEKKHRFADWIEMDGFHCKGYFTDWTHARDLVGNRLYEQMMMTRPVGSRRPYMKSDIWSAKDTDILADTNIKCHIDGFPCELYINGSYWGLYSINIKKERKNYKLDKSNESMVMIDPDEVTLTTAGFNWTKAEVRNPKIATDKDGNKYDGDHPTEIADGTTKTIINQFLANVSSIGSATTHEQVSSFLDIQEVVDAILLMDFICAWDCMGRNTLWTTWDGVRFAPLVYDLDLTFGIWCDNNFPTGDVVVSYNFETFSQKGNRLCPWLPRLMTILAEDLRVRYAELRENGVFTTDNVVALFDEFTHEVGSNAYSDDAKRWNYPSLGNARPDGSQKNFIESMIRISDYMKKRINNHLDVKYNYNK